MPQRWLHAGLGGQHLPEALASLLSAPLYSYRAVSSRNAGPGLCVHSSRMTQGPLAACRIQLIHAGTSLLLTASLWAQVRAATGGLARQVSKWPAHCAFHPHGSELGSLLVLGRVTFVAAPGLAWEG